MGGEVSAVGVAACAKCGTDKECPTVDAATPTDCPADTFTSRDSET